MVSTLLLVFISQVRGLLCEVCYCVLCVTGWGGLKVVGMLLCSVQHVKA